MNKHALKSTPPRAARRMAYELVRRMVESWPLWRATVGPEVVNSVAAEYDAHDAWENEGGACAYAD